jgi:hypothetical protein
VTFDFDGNKGRQLAETWNVRPHRRTGNGGFHLDVRYPESLSDDKRVEAEPLISRALEQAAVSGRNNASLWLGCQLRDNNYSESETETVMREYARRCSMVNIKGQREAYDHEIRATIRQVFSRAPRDPWTQKSQNFQDPPPEPSQASGVSAKTHEKKKPPVPVPLSAEELLTTDLIEPEPIIDDLLYPGVTMLVGRPKVGKSFAALHAAVCLVTGQSFAGHFRVRKGCRVLYLALEEPSWRTRRRLKKLFRGAQPDGLHDLKFIYRLESLYAGGVAQLNQLLTKYPTDVLIVDTLLASTKGAKQSRDLLRADYADVDLFQQLADKYKITVLLVHHTRKPTLGGLNDDIDCVTGTSGRSQ